MAGDLRRHTVTKGYIDRFWDNLVKVGKDKVTQPYLKTRLALLEDYWRRYETTHFDLVGSDDRAAVAYVESDAFATTEDSYVIAKTRILAWMKEDPASSRTDVAATTRPTQLPKITLPTFAGDQLEWESFRDRFRSLVGDVSDVAPVQKLQYLMSCLSGEAAAAVANVEMTDRGYELAWTELQSQYDNRRVLLATHMRTFLGSPVMTKPSSVELRRLSSAVRQARRSFEALGRPVAHWDDWFVHVIVEKMDSASRLLWEASLKTSTDFPTLEQLRDFLRTRIRALEAANPKSTTPAPGTTKVDKKPKVTALTTAASGKAARRCVICQGNHLFNYCPRFKELPVPQRRDHVKKQGACFNCLRPSHAVSSCPSGSRCQRCGEKHHSLLHQAEFTAASSGDSASGDASASASSRPDAPSDTAIASNVAALTSSAGTQVLLSTARLVCFGAAGGEVTARALLDSGSEASFVTEQVAQRLRLPRQRVHVPVSGIQGASSGVATHAVAMTVGSSRDPDVRLHIPWALVLPRLTSRLPARRVQREDWPHLAGLPLADPEYDRPATVDVILGADAFGALLREGLRRGDGGAPAAQATALGWILMGPVPALASGHGGSSVSAHHVSASGDGLDLALQRFWLLEELPSEPALKPEDLQCEREFAATLSRAPQGRYTVRMPKRGNDEIRLGPNRREALALLMGLERRLSRRPPLRDRYVDFMEEYRRLGHMAVVPSTEIHRTDANYLPHHAVFKGESDRIRVVFNASYRTSTGYSLNDLLLPGPKLQSELWAILSRWRLFRYVFTTDIVKMFRQISVHREDTDLQRILWRSDPSGEVQDFRLLTVVYGTASAPYLALRTLRQLAEDEGSALPLGASAIRSHSYVDDILTGGQTLEEATETRRQTQAILAAGGFELSKWAANVPELWPDEEPCDRMFCDHEGVGTLGVLWSPRDDCFALRVAPAMTTRDPTKRTVLSDVARFFDPLGWAAPVLVFGKILIQDLWMAGLSWDEALPERLRIAWTMFAGALPQLDQLRVPRWVGFRGPECAMELHGFSDAASRAYAAVVYLRSVDPSGSITVRILIAKTKVAPIRPVSIPRLELCGAVLLARLLRSVERGLETKGVPIFAWTDATVALTWIRSHPARWKPFVAHRVAEVQDLVPPQQWGYVHTKDNPADAATRGLSPAALADHDLWWSGPSWLAEQHYCAAEPSGPSGAVEVEELRPGVALIARAEEPNELLHRYSSLMRLLRVTALCLRFRHNLRHPGDRRTGFLRAEELRSARQQWIRVAQAEEFHEEISRIQNGQPLPAGSPLLPLRPMLDPDALLRVGGRLQQALLPFDEKHPVILGKSGYLSRLIVREAHAVSLHGGPQLTRSLILRHYWILRANSLIRSVIHACLRCARFRGVAAAQQMGHLPAERTRPSRPFLIAGVDYAGPVPLRTSKGRGHKSIKGYICLFVCLSSKAVHLEAVSDLSSASFLAAFKRFISRRGHCQRLVSDNGTNFRGAARELRAMFNAASEFYKESAASLAGDGTDWAFIPPSAPHFGGLWEAGVKSVKYHLRRVVGDACLTYEEMSTLLAQVEACLNSRPLHALSGDPSDLAALTPGHLLIGEALTAVPTPSSTDPRPASLPTRWALTSAMRDHFWRRWSTEYIHHLQQLKRWRRRAPNLDVGTLVLVRSELQPPTKWALARVIELHPGPDGLVRVATVRTATSVLKRPITKLVPLPVAEDAGAN